MSFVSRGIDIWQCYCNVFTAFHCRCTSTKMVREKLGESKKPWRLLGESWDLYGRDFFSTTINYSSCFLVFFKWDLDVKSWELHVFSRLVLPHHFCVSFVSCNWCQKFSGKHRGGRIIFGNSREICSRLGGGNPSFLYDRSSFVVTRVNVVRRIFCI